MQSTAPRPDFRQLARHYEVARDLPAALNAWQQALAQDPEAPDIARHLADLAFRLRHWDMAEKLLAHLIVRGFRDTPTVCAYTAALREQSRYDEAIDLLKSVIGQTPGESQLWEGLGAVMLAKGDPDMAIVFFDEALRLDPDNLHALFNRACALAERGDLRTGLAHARTCAEAFRDPDNICSAGMVSAYLALAQGDLKQGWMWYDARHRRGTPGEVHYDLGLPRLQPDTELTGRRPFLSAEQGLGDEVLYGSLIPEIFAAIGPDGHLGIGVEPRLVSLFARSFPQATVVAHRTRTENGRIQREFPDLPKGAFDSWALFGDFLPTLRGNIDDFATQAAFLVPDPNRVSHWRDWLASLGPPPKVGVLWKSLKAGANRDRYFADFELWLETLKTPDITFINLQYGESSREVQTAAAAGVTLHLPPGIDLKDDLDDLAALCTALDIVMGPANATTNISAACGATTWFLGLKQAWTRLGTETLPWYPSARFFAAPRAGEWQPGLDALGAALHAL